MRWMIVILGLFLSGCYAHYQGRYQPPRYQGPPPLQTTTIDQVNAMAGAQQPAGYKVGFMEGCDSGHLSAGNTSYLFKKDSTRLETDDAYKQGWSDGFNRCASGDGVTTSNYNQGYYGYNYYYPGTFSTGLYSPSYYYAPGYSLWLGYYGYPRHRHYTYRRNYTIPPGITGTGTGARRIEAIGGVSHEADVMAKAIEDGVEEAVKVGVVKAKAGAVEVVVSGFVD